jgi:hypothetical protein
VKGRDDLCFRCHSYLPVTQHLNIINFSASMVQYVIKRLTKISCEAKDGLHEACCPSLKDFQESLKRRCSEGSWDFIFQPLLHPGFYL